MKMNKDILNLRNTFDTIINKYDEGLMFSNNDTMISWTAQCDWLVKQLVDLKVGAGFKYLEMQKEYNPLKVNDNLGEGEESE